MIRLVRGVVLALALAPAVSSAQTLSAAETEALVRAVYYEGMPEEPATRIGLAGARRLVEMLADPGEAASHGQILLALGLSGSPVALDAMQVWIATRRSGEIDRDTFRAWQALPYALGHLARHDRRALVPLEAWMNSDAPGWTFRHQRGARLARLARDSAATSLALTGLPEAANALERAGRNSSDPGFREHLKAVRALQRERAPGPAQ